MPSTLSPNMNLIVPGVGSEPGPTWANDLNADLGILDQHNHAAGQGVQVTPDGLDINRDLTINGNNLIDARSIRFVSQAGIPGVAPDLGIIYVSGNELVYNDENGNVVPITNNGSVNSGAGSITGLPSGTASASYSSLNQTFIWQSSTSTPANMDFGSAILRNILPNSKGLTLSPPSSLAADYSIVFPLLPITTSFVTIDPSGNMGTTTNIGTTNLVDGSVTQPKLAPRATGSTVPIGGYATSPSSGSFSTTSTSPTLIPGLSVTITTTGRPVVVGLIHDASSISTPGTVAVSSGSTAALGNISLFNTGILVSLSLFGLGTTGTFQISSSSFSAIDPAPAGTYTYTAQISSQNTSATTSIFNSILFAYEM